MNATQSIWDQYPGIRDLAATMIENLAPTADIQAAITEKFGRKFNITTTRISSLRMGLAKGRWPSPPRAERAEKGKENSAGEDVFAKTPSPDPSPKTPTIEGTKPYRKQHVGCGERSEPHRKEPAHDRMKDRAGLKPAPTPPPLTPPAKGGESEGPADAISIKALADMLSEEPVASCQIQGMKRVAKISCLKRQVNAAKRYTRDPSTNPRVESLNAPFLSCLGCKYWLSDEDYRAVTALVKGGLRLTPVKRDP